MMFGRGSSNGKGALNNHSSNENLLKCMNETNLISRNAYSHNAY